MKMKAKSLLVAIVALATLGAFGAILYMQAMRLREGVGRLGEDVRVSVFSLDGKVVYDSAGGTLENHADRLEFEAVKDGSPRTIVRHSHTLDLDMLYCARRVGEHVVRIAVPYTAVTDAVRRTEKTLAAAALIGALAFMFISLLARNINAKERQLADLRRLESFRRDFIANLTHELRTPLTAIKAAAEMLGENGSALSPEERKELLDILARQSGKLDTLAQDILSLARIEARQNQPAPDFAVFDLRDILNAAVCAERPRAEIAGIALEVIGGGDEKIERPCDAQLVEQALANLIGNAILHSKTGRIEVSLSRTAQGKAAFAVRDYGTGIPAKDRDRIFERFYRVDKSRSDSSGGTGLGLAIVKHIATLHGGTIRLEPLSNGSRFVLEI